MPGSGAPRITPLKDGPLAFEENECRSACLTDADGAPFTERGPHMLCRCGGSASKPFCDGSHMCNGFESENLSDHRRDHRDDYGTDEIVVHDNRQQCAHAEECIHGSPEVFHKMHRPWITPEGTDADALAEVIRRCPSGALAYTRGEEDWVQTERPPRVRVMPGGPYRVEGGVELAVDEGDWAEGVGREHYALCRCGGSKNKPFCDGTHWRNGFAEGGE